MTPIQKLIAEKGGCPAFAEWSGEPVRNVQRWAAGSHAPRLADGARILRLSDAEMSEETEDENTAIISSTALLACPECGGTLKQWPCDDPANPDDYFECEGCEFSCESDHNRQTGELFPVLKKAS